MKNNHHKTNIPLLALIGAVGAVVIIWIATSKDQGRRYETIKKEAMTSKYDLDVFAVDMPAYQELLKKVNREEQIISLFGPDGHHEQLTEFICETLKDPESYVPISTKWVDGDEGIIVGHRYWSEDYLGEKHTGWVVIEMDLRGKVLKVVSESSPLNGTQK